MLGTKLLQFQDRKLRLLEDETKSLDALNTERNGDGVALMEQLVVECLLYPAEMEHVWKYVRKVMTSGARVDYEKTGRLLKELFTRQIQLLTRVHAVASELSKQKGREVARCDELIDALAALQATETRILSTWPWEDEPLPEFGPFDREKAWQDYLGWQMGRCCDYSRASQRGGSLEEGT